MTKCFYEYFSILPRSHSLEVLLGFEVELGLCANTAEREKQVFSLKIVKNMLMSVSFICGHRQWVIFAYLIFHGRYHRDVRSEGGGGRLEQGKGLSLDISPRPSLKLCWQQLLASCHELRR